MLRRTPLPIVAFLLALPSGVGAQDSDTLPPESDLRGAAAVVGFVAGLPTHPGVDLELARFDHGRLDADYRRAFAGKAREHVGTRVAAALTEFEVAGCSPGVRVEYPGERFSGHPEPSDVEEDFEDSLVLTRSTACYDTDVGADTLLALYASREVRMEAQSRMDDMFEEGGLVCYDVGGVPLLLSPTLSCNEVTRATDAGWAAEHSQSVFSEIEGRQPVYFKESLKAAVRLRDGGVGLVHVTLTRSTGLGGLEKRLGRGRIEDSLRDQVEVLRRHLRGRGTH